MNKWLFGIITVLVCMTVFCTICVASPNVVMTTDTTVGLTEHGRLRIPSEAVDVPLYLIHDTCTCCYMGLWNGGKIDTDYVQMFESVNIGDWVYIEPDWLVSECGNMVLECVDITNCLQIGNILISTRGFVCVNGDVLICVSSENSLFVQVFRLVML